MVERLGLEPHPEGGWFTRTWVHPGPAGAESPSGTASEATGGRAAGSAILYLLDAGTTSRWHRVDAAEIWIHGSGGPLVLETWADGDAAVRRTRLGDATDDTAAPQSVVEPGVWQRAVGGPGWTLVTCVVVPEFREDGFELADPDWSPPVD